MDMTEKGIAENTRDSKNRFIEFSKMHDFRAMNTWSQKPLREIGDS